MTSKHHIEIDGTGYLIAARSYRRTGAGKGSGWRTWQQADWRKGDGQRVQADPGRWWGGCGLDSSRAGRLSLGAGLAVSFANGEDGFSAMASFLGRLYAAARTSGKLYGFDGISWALDWDSGKASLRCMARHGGKLYAGSGSDGAVMSTAGGGIWTTALTIAGAVAIGAIAGYGIWDSASSATKPKLWVAAEYSGGQAKVHHWDGTTQAESYTLEEGRVEAMAVYGGRLYVATSETGNGPQGRLFCFDGRSASGEWSEVAWIPDSYVAGMAVFDGLLFCGSGTGGGVWAFDGTRLVEAYDLAEQGVVDPGPLRALSVSGGRLYVGYNRPGEGAALLCKLSAAAALDTVVPVAGGGDLAASRLGWSTPSSTGSAGYVASMASYGGDLYLARDATSSATIYQRDPARPNPSTPSTTSDLSDFDGGEPGQPKLLRRLTVNHEKLAQGDQVKVSFALEGSDLFQRLETFDDLSGADVASSSADWRVSYSLGRLLGMPAQTFAGKLPGSSTVPHLGRTLAVGNPRPGPASFETELTAAHYSAIAAEGGDQAKVSSAVDGDYAAMLFEFDLAGLNPYGLHPRAVVRGEGDLFGMPYYSANLWIWNHQTLAWDMIGSNSATPETPIEAWAIETQVVANSDFYLSPAGKLYLMARSGVAGRPSNPARVVVDYAGLEGFWAGSGELVSSPIVLPVSGAVTQATLRLLDSEVPAGCAIRLYLTGDGGNHWEAVTGGMPHVLAYSGGDLRWMAELTGPGTATPVIRLLALDVEYGTGGGWMPLGTSDVAGSTSRSFEFSPGAVARRLGLRVELSTEGGSGPVVTGISLEYSPASGGKRQWRFAARCEGAPGTMLRLLDGSNEPLSGAELSRRLWAAKAREVVNFVDLDGTTYTAWFEGLDESLGDLAQERGPQTVADCRLLEC